MVQITIQVEGMHCGMCESYVNNIVRSVGGVKKVKSSHSKGRTVVVAEDGVNAEDIVRAITAQGYKAGEIKSEPCAKRGLFGRARRKD